MGDIEVRVPCTKFYLVPKALNQITLKNNQKTINKLQGNVEDWSRFLRQFRDKSKSLDLAPILHPQIISRQFLQKRKKERQLF